MHGFLASVLYSVRLLLKSPGFTITAVLILGFGIGANTAIFSLIDTVVLRPPPYPYPDRLVKVGYTTKALGDGYVSLLNYLDLRATQQSFADLAVRERAQRKNHELTRIEPRMNTDSHPS
jgi:hypothetical protein